MCFSEQPPPDDEQPGVSLTRAFGAREPGHHVPGRVNPPWRREHQTGAPLVGSVIRRLRMLQDGLAGLVKDWRAGGQGLVDRLSGELATPVDVSACPAASVPTGDNCDMALRPRQDTGGVSGEAISGAGSTARTSWNLMLPQDPAARAICAFGARRCRRRVFSLFPGDGTRPERANALARGPW